MSNNFFGKNIQRPIPRNEPLQDEINRCQARISEAHQVLERLKQDIDKRCQKLQSTFEFLDSKKALYDQLIAQYQQQPSTSLANRIQKLYQAIEDTLANIEATEPEKIIADLSTNYEALKTELVRKEASLLTQILLQEVEEQTIPSLY